MVNLEGFNCVSRGQRAQHADFSADIFQGVLCITDIDLGGPSVTNDVEHVLRVLQAAGYPVTTAPVIYRDSTGIWDLIEVDHASGEFVRFVSLNERFQEDAIIRATIHHIS
jgi:hypothetical protein